MSASCMNVLRLTSGAFASAALFAVAGSVASALAAPTLTNLGVLPGGLWAEANAVSGDGSTVVGVSFVPGTGRRAFRWTSTGGMQNLGVFAGGTLSNAQAVNADGSVVVGFGTITGGFNRAFRWTAGSGLVNLGISAGYTGIEAYGVSANGSVVACGLSNSSVIVGGRWTSGTGVVVLSSLPAQTSTIAQAISAEGTTLVGSSGLRTTRWVNSAIQDLGMPAGFFAASARAVSSDGSAIAGDAFNPGAGEAFRWTSAGGMQAIGTLGGSSAVAYGISGNGSIVVGRARNASNQDRAFVWTPGGGMRDLNAVLAAQGVSIPGMTLVSARGISADGRSIAGIADLNADSAAFLITGLNLCPSDVAGANQSSTPDGTLTADDIIVYLGWYFASDTRADVAGANQSPTPDGSLTADDIIVFLGRFFAGC